MAKMIMMLFVILFTVNADAQDYKHHRQLRRGSTSSGSRSSSSSSRTSSRSSYASSYSRNTTKVSTYNAYFKDGRTYQPLTSYYLPPAYYQAGGYYSSQYKKTYYNGYGWNFYYQQGNYYANSPNAAKPSSSGLSLDDMNMDVLKAVAVMSVVAVQWFWSRM